MPNPRILAAFASFVFASAASAQVPSLLGYQGRLLRSDGTAATGTASVTFGVWDAATGGSRLWTETQTLGLSDGFYATFLGLVAPAPASLFGGGGRWLEVAVGAETVSPRQQIASVPFAMAAQSVSGGTADVTALKVGGAVVVDASGRLAGTARYSGGSGIAVDAASQTVSLQPCAIGQVLVRDATSWQCAAANAGVVTGISAVAPLAVAGDVATPQLSITQAGSSSPGFVSTADWAEFHAKYGATTLCGGDLSGALSAPTVTRLQSRPVAPSEPGNGQVLKWTASTSRWEPSPDLNSGGTVTNVVATAPLAAQNGTTNAELSIVQAGATSDGYLASTDFAAFQAKYGAATACGGDLDGTLASPVVARLQGVPVATNAPTTSQVMRFDGAAWAPASLQIGDVGGLSSGYLDLSGTQTIGGAKTFTSAPQFGSPLGIASGGTASSSAAANSVFAGPDGAWGVPSFRGLSAADIPVLDAGKLASGTLGVERGGTGAASFAAGSILYGNGSAAVGAVAGSSGQVLVSGGGASPTWSSAPSLAGTNLSAVPQSAVTNLASDLSARPTGAGTSGHLARWSGGSAIAASSVLYDDGSRVGVGTTSPLAPLHVRWDSQAAPAAGSVMGNSALVVSGTDANIDLLSRDDNSDVAANIGLGRYRDSDGTLEGKFGITAFADTGAQNSNLLDRLSVGYGTNASAWNNSELLTVKRGGNVGIGTASPGSKLEVNGNVAIPITAKMFFNGSTDSSWSLGKDTTGAQLVTAGDLAMTIYGASNQGFMIRDHNNNSRFELTGDGSKVYMAGSLGIGTTAPKAKLSVAGGVQVGSDPGSCTSDKAGTLRWNGDMQVCDGSNWRALVAWNCASSPSHAGCVSSSTYTSCKAIRNDPNFSGSSGEYFIDTDGLGSAYSPFKTYCDMTTDGGGYTLVLHLLNPTSQLSGASRNTFWADGMNLSGWAQQTFSSMSTTDYGFAGWNRLKPLLTGGDVNFLAKGTNNNGNAVAGEVYTAQAFNVNTANTTTETGNLAGGGKWSAAVFNDSDTRSSWGSCGQFTGANAHVGFGLCTAGFDGNVPAGRVVQIWHYGDWSSCVNISLGTSSTTQNYTYPCRNAEIYLYMRE